MWDVLARFARHVPEASQRGFADDFIDAAAQESHHFLLWEARLRSLGSKYGALPTHAGLWTTARQTSHDVLARLALERLAVVAGKHSLLPIAPLCGRVAATEQHEQVPSGYAAR